MKIKKSVIESVVFFFILFIALCCLDSWFSAGVVEKVIICALLLAARTLGFVEGMSDD